MCPHEHVPPRERARYRYRHHALLRSDAEAARLQRLTRHQRTGAPARVECNQLLLLGEPDDCEHVAADASHVRFRHTQHRRRGNGGVDRIAATAKHLQAGRRGKRLACRDHSVGCVDSRATGHGSRPLAMKRCGGADQRNGCVGGDERSANVHHRVSKENADAPSRARQPWRTVRCWFGRELTHDMLITQTLAEYRCTPRGRSGNRMRAIS